MDNNKLPKSQIAKITLLLLLFLTLLRLIPFISPSMRSSYLYLLLNLLIVVLGAEAGFLAAILKPREAHDVEKKPALNVIDVAHDHTGSTLTTTEIAMVDNNEKKKITTVTTTSSSASSNSSTVERSLKLMKKCKSRPSLFFIGGSDDDEELEEEVVVINSDNDNNNNNNQNEYDEIKRSREEGEVMSKQELFNTAEVFIGNFYNQLKMQREHSWKKLHGIYHKALTK